MRSLTTPEQNLGRLIPRCDPVAVRRWAALMRATPPERRIINRMRWGKNCCALGALLPENCAPDLQTGEHVLSLLGHPYPAREGGTLVWSVAQLNDTGLMTFEQIADLVEGLIQ